MRPFLRRAFVSATQCRESGLKGVEMVEQNTAALGVVEQTLASLEAEFPSAQCVSLSAKFNSLSKEAPGSA